MAWQPIESAPKDGSWFLAWQDGEIYHASYDIKGPPRLMWRTHQLWNPQTYRIIDVELDGEATEARVLVSEGPEEFKHQSTFWTLGFDFAPTLWMPIALPAPHTPLEG